MPLEFPNFIKMQERTCNYGKKKPQCFYSHSTCVLVSTHLRLHLNESSSEAIQHCQLLGSSIPLTMFQSEVISFPVLPE